MGGLITEKPSQANSKLTPELFKRGGVATGAGTEEPLKDDELTPRQPMFSKAEILRQGHEALIQLHRGNDWERWTKVLPVLDIARSTAMLEAGTNEPKGRRYSDAYGRWFRCHPQFEALAKLDSGLRARFFECFANLAAIDEWRAGRPPEQQLRLNYPTTVLAHWKKHNEVRTGARNGKKHSPDKPVSAPEPAMMITAAPVSTADPAITPEPPTLADVWAAASLEDKQNIVNREGRIGLARIAPSALLVELGNHALGLQINSAPIPDMDADTDVRVTLSKLFRRAIAVPEEADDACAAFHRKCAANNLSASDLVVTFADFRKGRSAKSRSKKRKG
jgi:hypothetical protein